MDKKKCRTRFTLFSPRINDYQNKFKQRQVLSIDREKFIKPADEFPLRPGSVTFGPFHVKRTPRSRDKIYFVTGHDVANEYFALELLQYIGINTPKLRVAEGDFANDNYHPTLVKKHVSIKSAVKMLPDFISMGKLLQPDNPVQLDCQRQMVHTNKFGDFKISGNVFAAFIGAWLVSDVDFGLQGANFGLMLIGNRYYSAAIDKDCAKFSDSSVRYLHFRRAKIFEATTLDQELFIINRIALGLKEDKKGVSDFDRIFINSRVQCTPELNEDSEKMCKNLKARASKIIQLYQLKNPDCLQEFNLREAERMGLVDEVLKKLDIPRLEKNTLRDLMLEDLRGPYYQHLKPEAIAEKLLEDFSNEFNLSVQKNGIKRRKCT